MFFNKYKYLIFDKLLWYKSNKTLWAMLLLVNKQL